MVLKEASILESSTIERLETLAAHVSVDKGWIRIVRISSITSGIRECVPETIESVENLKYLGLTQNAALKALVVYARKGESKKHVNEALIEWAKRHVKKLPDCWKTNPVSEWDGVMKRLDVQDSRRNAILDARFTKLR